MFGMWKKMIKIYEFENGEYFKKEEVWELLETRKYALKNANCCKCIYRHECNLVEPKNSFCNMVVREIENIINQLFGE